MPQIDRTPGLLVSSILIGCAWTDSVHTSVSTVVSGVYKAAVEQAASDLARSIWSRKDDFAIDSITADLEGSARMALEADRLPVFISDSGDNTTAGAAGDSPLFLKYLTESATPDALVAGITDPAAVCVCEAAGPGAAVRLEVGGKLDAVHAVPFECEAVIKRVVTRDCPGEDRDSRALVCVGGVDVVLQSDRRPFTQLGHFREMGLDPEDYRAVVVKEGYLFPELRDYAPYHVMALSPGFGDQRLDQLPFKALRRPICPLDPNVEWEGP